MAMSPALPRQTLQFRFGRWLFWTLQARPSLHGLLARFWPSVTVSRAGLRLRLYPGRNYQDRVLWSSGAFSEKRSMAALLDAVRGRRTLILDIGANSGMYSVTLARAAGEGSEIHAFEPNPVLQRQLRENLALNGVLDRVNLHGVALGASEGTTRLHLHGWNLGQASLRPEAAEAGAITVPVRQLHTYMRDAGRFDRIVAKVDIEGVEDLALLPFFQDAPQAQLPDILLLETEHQHLWDPAFLARLAALGYRARFTDEGNTIFDRDRSAAGETLKKGTAGA